MANKALYGSDDNAFHFNIFRVRKLSLPSFDAVGASEKPYLGVGFVLDFRNLPQVLVVRETNGDFDDSIFNLKVSEAWGRIEVRGAVALVSGVNGNLEIEAERQFCADEVLRNI